MMCCDPKALWSQRCRKKTERPLEPRASPSSGCQREDLDTSMESVREMCTHKMTGVLPHPCTVTAMPDVSSSPHCLPLPEAFQQLWEPSAAPGNGCQLRAGVARTTGMGPCRPGRRGAGGEQAGSRGNTPMGLPGIRFIPFPSMSVRGCAKFCVLVLAQSSELCK